MVTPYERIQRSSRFAALMLQKMMPTDFPDAMERMRREVSGQAVGGSAPTAVVVSTEAKVSSSAFAPLEVIIEPGQPDCLFASDGGAMPYRGQEVVKRRLCMRVDQLSTTGRIKGLFTGPAGTGKTTLARLIAERIRRRHAVLGVTPGPYFELLPAQVESKQLLDEFMRTVVAHPTAIVFIDEIHTLKNREALFHTLHDSGAPKYPLLDGSWLPVPSTVSWMAATTDPGELDDTTGGALRRRLSPELVLEAPSADVLAEIVQDLAESNGMQIDPQAAQALGGRGLFPWQVVEMFGETVLVARHEGDSFISPTHVETAFEVLGVDEHGLLTEDRNVIAMLLQCPYKMATQPGVVRYKLGEEALCAAAGLDRKTYKKRVQPKLVRLGYLVTTGGQCLTDKALADYGHLRRSRNAHTSSGAS